jgi:hypothetical protein
MLPSCPRFRTPHSLWASLLLSAVGSAALTVGCGDPVVYRGIHKEAPAANETETEYSLKVYVTDSDGTRLVAIPPVERGAAHPEDVDGSGGTGNRAQKHRAQSVKTEDDARPGLGLLGLVDLGEGGAPKDTEEEDAKPGGYPGWTFLHWALASCYDPVYDSFDVSITPNLWCPVDGWCWYVFGHDFISRDVSDCDEQLAAQELLLCTADRLAEVGDSVGKVVWHSNASWWDDITVTIPPQATKDKFIARDMAMNVLAHLAKLNSLTIWHESWPEGDTCDDAYAALANATWDEAVWPGTLPREGVDEESRTIHSYFPPVDAPDYEGELTTDYDMRRIGIARLERKAALLSAAGRLMKSLIEESVDADLAGAEAKRAAAGDAAQGAKDFWGRDAEEPYNSMRHVLSVLYGRMEMGPSDPSLDCYVRWDPDGPTQYDPAYEPECNAVPSTALVDVLPHQRSREAIVPPSTAGQAKALALLQSAGIVIRPDLWEQYMSANDGVDVVKNQLVLHTAAATGQEVSELALLGEAAAEVWDGLSMADKRYALGQIYEAVQLMSVDDPSTGMTPSEQAKAAGLKVRDISDPDETLDPELYDAHGFVLAGGVPLENLSIDLTATLGQVQSGIQCNTYGPSGYWDRTKDQTIATQGAFEVGVVLRRALTHMKGLTEDTGDAELSRYLEAATAELAAWVGPGELSIWSFLDGGVDNLDLRITGMQPSDLGAADWTEVQERLVLVAGPHYNAEYIAGLRNSEAPLDVSDNVYLPAGSYECTGDATGDGFAKGYSCWNAFFAETPDPASSTSPTMYVVMKPSATKAGQVVAALWPRDSTDRVAVVSRLRSELSARAFAMKEPAYRGTTCSGVTDFLDQQRYCLDMPRHMFVPLANELTSEGGTAEDSWSHYLAVAKEAAAKADELGRQMIELGIAKDLRAEAAVEEVGNLCGAFPNVDDISFENNVPDTEVNAAVKACLGEGKKDVVFLTDDPYPQGDEARLKTELCDSVSEGRKPPFCEKEDPSTIAHAGLGLSKAPEPPPDEDPCEIVPSAQPVRNASGVTIPQEAFGQMAWADYASQTKLADAIDNLKMAQTERGWTLTYGDELLMGDLDLVPTNNADVWPACAEANDPLYPCTERAQKLGALFPADGTYAAGDERWEADVALQVEDALYWLGVLAGHIPGCALSKPIPLVEWTWHGGGFAPIPVVYTPGSMKLEGSVWHLNLGAAEWLNLNDSAEVGDAWIPDSAYYPRFDVLGPSWVNEVRAAPAGGLYYFQKCNASITFQEQLANPLTGASNAGTRAAGLGAWLTAAASLTDEVSGAQLEETIGKRAEAMEDTEEAGSGTDEYSVSRPYATYPPCGYKFSKASGIIPTNAATGSLVGPACDADEALADMSGQAGPDDQFRDHIMPSCAGEGTSPHYCHAEERMQLFWSTRPTDTAKGLIQPFARALGLSCHLTHREVVLPEGSLPPDDIVSPEDLLRLEIWVARAAEKCEEAIQRLQVYNVPDRVLQDFREGLVGSGTIGQGKHGDLVIQYGNALRAMHQAWVTLGSGFRQLNGAINGARISIEASGLSRDQAFMDIARQQLDVHRQMALIEVDEAQTIFDGIVGAGSGLASLNPFAALGAAGDAEFNLEKSKINTEYWQSMAEQFESDEAVLGAIYQNGVAKALADLSREAPALYGAIDGALSALQSAVADAHLAANGLAGNEQSARYALAKAAGADFVNASGGENGAVVPLHMNTVYNRAFAVTEQRYKDALDRAKRAAYIARLAIEQRLGVRLENLDSALGPIDAPALWAEQLCSLQGINYDDLKASDPSAVGGDTFDVWAFADRYIGDYVDKLSEFVEFYNIANPFKEGTDSAIISVREDVGHSGTQCFAESRNLLYESERLFSRGTPEGDESRLGWRTSPCNTTACLEVMPGDALINSEGGLPVPVEGPDGMGAASWLLTTERGDRDEGDGSVPPAIVYQTVDLEAGTVYVLSWWDLARDPEGGQYDDDDDPLRYRTVVYSDEWSVVATDIFTPSNNEDGSWGSRRVMPFTVVESGTYHVAFKGASSDQAGASLAIANVQLEVLEDVSEASAYEPTGRSRSVLSTDCKTMGKEGWQQAFRRVCGGDGCYYELKDPLVIDTEAINHGQTSLVGKFAPGNYNYRNGTVALNLVGTGVIDCEDDDRMSCYGSGYVAYELEHQASNVKVLDNGQDVTCFDFRTGTIRGGKALATERFITLPMSSSDKALIEQPGFLKGELAGRPLDGTYRLRIKETPALRWENLEDIQLVFNYGYWSAVDVANAL